MAEVRATGTISAPVDEVWALVGDFGGIAGWLPTLISSELAPGATGTQIGDVRQCTMDGSMTFPETQTARSDADYTYSYTIPEGGLPMKNYASTIRLRAEGDQTVMEWTCVFDPDPGMEDEISDMTRGAYQANIDAQRQRFGS